MCVTSLPAARVGRCWQVASSPNSHRDFDTSLRGVGSLSPPWVQAACVATCLGLRGAVPGAAASPRGTLWSVFP